MQINILAVGDRSPSWVEAGVNQYIARMPRECSIEITPVAVAKRTKNQTLAQARAREQQLLIRRTSNNSVRVALDERGQSWTTVALAEKLRKWLQSSPILTFYIGGPDGFNAEFLRQANLTWSVSSLTLPHMLVRVLLVEQLYRAWRIIQGHPYHRQ